MSIQRPSCFFNLCSSCSCRSNKHQRDCLLPPPAAGYATAQASPPHRTPIPGLAIPLLTHTCCYSSGMADESSLAPCRSLPRPRSRPPPWCSWRSLVNVVNERHPSEVDCTWRGRQLGPRPHARKCLLITCKIMIPPPDSWDPPEGPLYFAKNVPPADRSDPPAISSHAWKCLVITYTKMNTPPASWDPP